ncbi:MAG: hypothetical protein L3J32_10200 [Rhizobiaceae bacterium]|nr:hypothetical protein [Rhizobiaceae bacterium]
MSTVQDQSALSALHNPVAYQREFIKWSAIAFLIITIISYFGGDAYLLTFIKASFAPIYVLVNQARKLIWPKSAIYSLKILLSERAIDSLIFSFAMLVMFIQPDRSFETLAKLYVFFLLGFFFTFVILDILLGPPNSRQSSKKQH